MPNRLTQEEFVLRAIETLRQGGHRGIHSVYSGFNEAFREYFGDGADPAGTTTKMAKEGKIATRPVKGGVMLYKPEDAPSNSKAQETLAKMGIK